MKKLILTILFCLMAGSGWCATRTISDAGGNWNATTSWAEGAVPVNGDDVVATATSGNLVVNANSANLKSFDLTGYTGTLSGTSSITVVGAASTTVDVKFAGTISWTGTLNLNPASATSCVIKLTTNAKALANIAIAGTSGGSVTLQDNLTFQAAKEHRLTLSNNNLNMAATTISGNSAINRILITSNTLGTARTVTISGAGTFANADFRDITLSASTNLSAITGGSGDCGGNTGITFTTADDWYWNGSGTQNLSDYTYWYTATNGGGSQMASTRSPLPQDTLYFDSNSIDGATTVDQDLPRIPGIDFTGCASMSFHMNNISQELYGSLVWNANVTATGTSHITLQSAPARSGTLSFGYSGNIGGLSIRAIGCTWQLIRDISCVDGYTGSLEAGTFDGNGYNFTGQLTNASSTLTRSLLMGGGTWTLRAYGSWNMSSTTNFTFDNESSPIILGAATSAETSFNGGGRTYSDITIQTSAKVCTIGGGNNTFSTFTINAPKTVKFTDGTDQEVTSFVAIGTAVNGITLTGSSTAGWKISDTTGTNAVEYCTISYSTAEGGATWNALTSAGNVDGGNNTGWDFGSTSRRMNMLIQ